ncbi:unnamed protein product [Spirodela intermedia]|uniref:Uncharacterized protein n=1 Tax=Spirodela intermedia TaxID=51605 RepID=A0A7I8J4Q1_SPIIN|nr:unnamed protein product [Spirodela intermedia]CAA6664361.1 unnamed protein product [Spirodela intermedia]
MLKTIPMLSTGCKMVALLGRPSRALLLGASTRRRRHSAWPSRKAHVPTLLPHRTAPPHHAFHKEMDSGVVKIALESESRSQRRKLLEEHVWAVYCNGRKSGYSIRRKHSSEEDWHLLMELLRGVSMGAGVLPALEESPDGEMTYMRARFERVVGSKDSEALYMVNPDGTGVPSLASSW